MRSLSIFERTLIEKIAEKMPEHVRSILLSDLDDATVENVVAGGEIISFALRNYQRPTYRGQHPYGVEGKILDKDGIEISVILYADENNRLLELEFIRWGEGAIIAPDLATLTLY